MLQEPAGCSSVRSGGTYLGSCPEGVLHKDLDVLLSAETSGASSCSSQVGGAEEMFSVFLADPDVSSITDSQTCRLQGELEEFWITETRIKDGRNHLMYLNPRWTHGRPVSTLMSL